MILDQIKADLVESMKARDEAKVSALRFLLSAIQNKGIEKQAELTDDDVIAVVARQIKERKESIEAFKNGGRVEMAEKEEGELSIISKYMPEQMPEEEVRKIVSETIAETGATTSADFGKVMQALMPKVKGKADGGIVSNIVKGLLNS